MPNQYYDTISDLQKQNIAPDYIVGWASGFLGNPKVEEQRITESYQAGYDDGKNRNIDNAKNWTPPPVENSAQP